MALCRQVVNLVGFNLFDNANQVGRVRHVTVVQVHLDALLVRVLVQVIDAIGIKRRRPPFNAVHVVALLQQ